MIRTSFTVMALAFAFSNSAPFCVALSYGKNCWYFDANTCRAAALRQGGICIYEEESPAPLIPTPRPFYGFGVGRSEQSATNATQPLIDLLSQQRENQRRQEEHDADLQRTREQIDLLRQQQQVERQKQEYYKSITATDEATEKTPTYSKSDLDWASKVLADTTSPASAKNLACQIYLHFNSVSESGKFDPRAYLCEQR